MNDIDVEYYLNLALTEAEKANKLKEVPIGAIVVNHEKTIIGKGYNKTEKELLKKVKKALVEKQKMEDFLGDLANNTPNEDQFK